MIVIHLYFRSVIYLSPRTCLCTLCILYIHLLYLIHVKTAVLREQLSTVISPSGWCCFVKTLNAGKHFGCNGVIMLLKRFENTRNYIRWRKLIGYIAWATKAYEQIFCPLKKKKYLNISLLTNEITAVASLCRLIMSNITF